MTPMTSIHDVSIARRRLLQGAVALTTGLLISGPATAASASARRFTSLGAQTDSPFGADEGAVFVATNHNNTTAPDEPANQVVMYARDVDGELTMIDAFDTGGQGSGPSKRFAGDGLGSGNSVRLSDDLRWLFVTNAGSDTVSVFAVEKDGLALKDVVPTGDSSQGERFPNSVTQHGKLVYVLNSADEGSITGFKLGKEGTLTPIEGSTRMLKANQTYAPDPLFNPAQIEFTPDGARLVVTIKDGPAEGILPDVTPTGPGRVLVFSVGEDGTPSDDFVQTELDNRGPFGFSFGPDDELLVAEFVGGEMEVIDGMEALTAAAGSYTIEKDGTLAPISAGVPNHQVDTCWLVNNGRYAYGSNYTSGTVSSYEIGKDGGLTLMKAVAGETDEVDNKQGSTPLDARVTRDGRFLYIILGGAGKIAGWHIGDDGALKKISEVEGLQPTRDGDTTPFEFTALGGSPAGIEAI